MGIGTLGFLKGATKTTLDSIEAREEAEMELKKQKDLEKFRADYRQQLEMKEATTFQTIKKPDGSYETVGFNKQGQRVTSRESTLPEIKTVEDAEVDRTDTLDKRERDKRRDDQVFNFADEDQRMQRETHSLGLKATQAQINASNRSGRPSIDSRDSEPADTMGVRGGKQLVAEYSTLVAAAVKAGLNPGLVEQWAVRQVANTRTGDEARQKFVQSLKAYIDEANTRKRNETNPTDPFDPKNPTFNWR